MLLMGIFQIAKSEKCLRLVIKLFVFSICTAGFTYQAWAFLQIYLAYPTAQDISEEYPDEIKAPAITICNNNRETNYRFVSTVSEEYIALPSQCHPQEERCTTRYLQINASFKRMMVHKFQHIPRFESIELFSYIGGYLGMWLGISLASLFDFGEMIYDIVQTCLKGKRNQKTEAPTEQLQLPTV